MDEYEYDFNYECRVGIFYALQSFVISFISISSEMKEMAASIFSRVLFICNIII